MYESGGNIYATFSYDNGANWEPELRVNQTLGGCFSPSITYNENRQQITIAWLQDIGGTRYAIVAISYGFGDTWTQVQIIAAPNAQQLQISSMTGGGSSDLLVWREGTLKLKGTLRRFWQSFGTVRYLRSKEGNYIDGFSLGAFGRTDRWDIVWTENGSLYYSSIYDYVSTGEPWMDFGITPAIVASGDIYENSNPSIVKTGSVLTVAWEAYDGR